MEQFVVFIEFLSIIINTLWLIFVLIRFFKGFRESVLVIIPIFYIFFTLPLILDLTIGPPFYNKYPGFLVASNDYTTKIIYSIYIVYIPFILYKYGRVRKIVNNIKYNDINTNRIKFILYILLFLPVLLILFSPNPLIYLNYAAATKGLLNLEESKFHYYVSLFSMVSILSYIILIFIKRGPLFSYSISLLPFIFIDIWVFGKRFIVATFFVLLVFVLWKKGILKGFRIIIIGIMSSVLIFLYSSIYQDKVRDYGSYSFEQKYTNFRIDYGRDAVTKLTIYSELNPDKIKILDFRGESFLFDLTFFVPRDIWPEKPYPYAQYVTSAVFFSQPKLWGWGFTTSIFEEMIANFSWFGMILAPFSIALICRISDSFNNGLISILGILIAMLLMVLQLAPYISIFMLWVFTVIIFKFKRIKAARSQSCFNIKNTV
jgi:hypothetical protein